MELALLIEDVCEYRGKDLEQYAFKWGSYNNGLEESLFLLRKYAECQIEYLYFGNEFCEYKIPSVSQLKKAIELCEQEGLKLVLVTPVVTDYGIEKIRLLLDFVEKEKNVIDIVVNDFGVLELIQKSDLTCEIIIGRIFDKTSHDSRAMGYELDAYYGKNGKKFAMTPGIISRYYLHIFKDYMINRFEFDLPKVGMKLPQNIKASLYWPYSYLTTGRVCLFRSIELKERSKFLVGNGCCGKLCKSYRIEKRKPINGLVFENGRRVTERFLFQKGNAVFYVNNREDVNQFINQFNRLIIQL